MTKEEFRAKQFELYNAENKLASDTNKVLFDILTQMTPEEREQLINLEGGYYIDDYSRLLSIDNTGVKVNDTEFNLINNFDLESLTQIQQKEIIDQLMHIWGFE